MPGPPASSAAQRRAAARTAIVWQALEARLGDRPLRVLDIGGGTGGFAVGLAERGHTVTVVDPSPDALASLDRRAAEHGVADRVEGLLGDLDALLDVVEPGADLVLCHGVLEVVDDPAAALGTLARVLAPEGTLSLLVAQRLAAVLGRAVAGHVHQALDLLTGSPEPGPPGRAGRRFDGGEVAALLEGAGFVVEACHGVRVFSDLVPGSLLDVEPGAADALLRLEQAASVDPALQAVATQLHVLATR